MRFSINHWTESQNTVVVALIMSVTDCATLEKSLGETPESVFPLLPSTCACHAATISTKVIPMNLLETAVVPTMAGILTYISPFSNASHVLNTNSPPKNPEMTSFTLRSSYPVLTTNLKSTTLHLQSSWDGIQLKGTCRSGPGQLLSMPGSKARTQDAALLPPLTLPRRAPWDPKSCLGVHGSVCHIPASVVPTEGKKTLQSWELLFKAHRWKAALPHRVQCICTKRLYIWYF